MQETRLPYVNLPEEFVSLLKTNTAALASSTAVFEPIRPNKALHSLLGSAFADLNDGRGLEKTMTALGWYNFRNRMASLYIHKAYYGQFPRKTDLTLVEDILGFETSFLAQGIQSNSRIFLLGFYLKMAQLHLQSRENNRFMELKLPVEQIQQVMRLSQARSDKADWLILTIYHFIDALGEKSLTQALITGKSFNDLYDSLGPEARRHLHDNLLAYSASIRENENFLFEKV